MTADDLVEIQIIIAAEAESGPYDMHWSDRYCGGEIW